MNKKVRGSAYTTAEGIFTFTPYVTNSHAENNQLVLKSGSYGTMYVGKNTLSVRLAFPKSALPPFSIWIEEIAKMYNSLTLDILE